MSDQKDKIMLDSVKIVTDITNVKGKLKVEFAEVTFPGEVEITKLKDRFFKLHQDPDGRLRFR